MRQENLNQQLTVTEIHSETQHDEHIPNQYYTAQYDSAILVMAPFFTIWKEISILNYICGI